MKKNENLREQLSTSAHHTGGERAEMSESLNKSDYLLAERLKKADRGASAELVDKYYNRLYLYMRRLGHNRAVSEELVQEIFLAAWQHIGQLTEAKALSSWIYRIAGNVSNACWRRKKRRKEETGAEQLELLDDSGGNLGYAEPQKIEQFRLLEKAVAELSDKLKQAVVLHYMQGLTITEAAHAAAVREGTFKSRLSRALKKLKKQMGHETGQVQ